MIKQIKVNTKLLLGGIGVGAGLFVAMSCGGGGGGGSTKPTSPVLTQTKPISGASAGQSLQLKDGTTISIPPGLMVDGSSYTLNYYQRQGPLQIGLGLVALTPTVSIVPASSNPVHRRTMTSGLDQPLTFTFPSRGMTQQAIDRGLTIIKVGAGASAHCFIGTSTVSADGNSITSSLSPQLLLKMREAGAPVEFNQFSIAVLDTPPHAAKIFGTSADVYVWENQTWRPAKPGELQGKSVDLLLHGFLSDYKLFTNTQCGGVSYADKLSADGHTIVAVDWPYVSSSIIANNATLVANALTKAGLTHVALGEGHSTGAPVLLGALGKMPGVQVDNVTLFNGALKGTPIANLPDELATLLFEVGDISDLLGGELGAALAALGGLADAIGLVAQELQPGNTAQSDAINSFVAAHGSSSMTLEAGTEPGSNSLYQFFANNVPGMSNSDGVVPVSSAEGQGTALDQLNPTIVTSPTNHDFANLACNDQTQFPSALVGTYSGTIDWPGGGGCDPIETYTVSISANGHFGTFVATWPAGGTETRQVSWDATQSQLVFDDTGSIFQLAYSNGTITAYAPSVCLVNGSPTTATFDALFSVTRGGPKKNTLKACVDSAGKTTNVRLSLSGKIGKKHR